MDIHTLVSPIAQPLNKLRLCDVLKSSLADIDKYDDFYLVVAYAKRSILDYMHDCLVAWKKSGNNLHAMVGIDQKVTSKEALEYLSDNFDSAKIINHKGTTFHPKVYLFKGEEYARLIIGSNNLTVGGLELNFESAVVVDFDLNDENDCKEFYGYWDELIYLSDEEHGISVDIDDKVIEKLNENNLVANEYPIPGIASERSESLRRHSVLNEIFNSSLKIKGRVKSKSKKTTKTKSKEKEKTTLVEGSIYGSGFESLYIQINPHHNGEIFLSKKAVNEYPDFFDFPFTGLTVPKTGSKQPPYPQREPDPIVNIVVFGKDNKQLIRMEGYDLNTVFYEAKKEIRITCSPLVNILPEYSLLIMNKPKIKKEIDYEMVIHTPESPYYEDYMKYCNKAMPTGGAVYKEGPLKGQKKPPRHYGWQLG